MVSLSNHTLLAMTELRTFYASININLAIFIGERIKEMDSRQDERPLVALTLRGPEGPNRRQNEMSENVFEPSRSSPFPSGR